MIKQKKLLALLFCIICFGTVSQTMQAAEIPNEKSAAEDFSYLSQCIPVFYYNDSNYPGLDKNGKAQVNWFINYYNNGTISYEIEIAANSNFKNAKKYTAEETQFTLKKSSFGTNGGTYYLRARSRVDLAAGEAMYSDWSETQQLTFVAINKKNFPGMYKLIKSGGEYSWDGKIEKITYDSNKDGWLDPKEIKSIHRLSTVAHSKKKDGYYYQAVPIKVSDLTGIEYLPNVEMVSLAQYSGKKADLSKNKVKWLELRGVTSKEITVIAPNVGDIFIEASSAAKLSKMNLSSCTGAVELTAYGNNKTKTLILPKTNKKLKVLSVSDFGIKTLNLNSYKSLQQLYLYKCDITSVRMDKCKNMKYLYFWWCEKIKSLDITANKKLKGVDFYGTKGLTKHTVKAPKSAKVTWEKGKWWYGTKDYEKDMNKFFQEIINRQ